MDMGTARVKRRSPEGTPGPSEPQAAADLLAVPSLGPISSGRGQPTTPGAKRTWAKFDGAELTVVCSHYDIGVIRAVKAYRRGSSRAPKAAIKTSTGLFLLKRRAPGRDNPYRVAFTHAVQLHLARHHYPVPRLVGTRDENNSMLQVNGRIYEMFEFVRGEPFDGSGAQAGEAGRALAWFHRLMANHSSRWTAPRGTYHRAPGLDTHFAALGDRLGPESRSVADRLRACLSEAAERVEALGAADWPDQIIHADWHPGNLLFHEGKAVAVLDFDSARLAPRAMDVANGVLQFSVVMEGANPSSWPAEPDKARIRRFMSRYEEVDDCRLSESEIQALPWLMLEALVVESVVPVARHGHFGGLPGLSMLAAAERKAEWLARNANIFTGLVG